MTRRVVCSQIGFGLDDSDSQMFSSDVVVQHTADQRSGEIDRWLKKDTARQSGSSSHAGPQSWVSET